MAPDPTNEQKTSELEAAGWAPEPRLQPGAWKSPWGALYLTIDSAYKTLQHWRNSDGHPGRTKDRTQDKE